MKADMPHNTRAVDQTCCVCGNRAVTKYGGGYCCMAHTPAFPKVGVPLTYLDQPPAPPQDAGAGETEGPTPTEVILQLTRLVDSHNRVSVGQRAEIAQLTREREELAVKFKRAEADAAEGHDLYLHTCGVLTQAEDRWEAAVARAEVAERAREELQKDKERVDYLLALLDGVVPAAEKAGDALARADIDRVMAIWPSPASCLAAFSAPSTPGEEKAG